MKASINPCRVKYIALVIFSAFSMTLMSQALPQIEARFTNPGFDKKSREYFLDVELNSKLSTESLFGMNLRFFYDPSVMEFKGVDQFKQGYGILGEAPKVFVGNEVSGVQLFNFSQAMAYVNGAVQLLDERFPLEITTTAWVKAFRVSFKVPLTTPNEEEFCPSVIWDLKVNTGDGGFLGGDGLLMTVTEDNRNTRFVSAPAISLGIPFNWEYNSGEARPYGNIAPSECISIATALATEDLDKIDVNGYALFQNQPNPFDLVTRIDFILPYAQDATLIFYDVDGAVKEEIKGYYVAGRNQVQLQQKAWMVESNLVYYRLQTKKYTSKTRTMTLVRA